MTLTFAYRYLVGKKSTSVINIIARVCIAAIAIVTAAMVIIWSVFNGLTGLVKSLYNGFYTDLKITPSTGKVIILTPAQLTSIRQIKGIKAIALIAEEKALLRTDENQAIVTLKGVDTNYTQITSITSNIVRGTYNIGSDTLPQLVLGYGVENALGITSNSIQGNVSIHLPNVSQKFTGSLADFSAGRATPSSTFAIQQEFDNKYAITNLVYMQSLMGLATNTYTCADVGLQPSTNLTALQQQVQKVLGNNYTVLTKYAQNKSLYSVMNTEKWMVYAIFCLVLIIASFTIVGALTMLVLEKQKDITILKSMGASAVLIKKIFLAEGLLIATIGIGIGLVIGVGICLLQYYFHIIKLQGNSFVIDYYPVQIQTGDLILITITIVIITMVASYLPAVKGARYVGTLR